MQAQNSDLRNAIHQLKGSSVQVNEFVRPFLTARPYKARSPDHVLFSRTYVSEFASVVNLCITISSFLFFFLTLFLLFIFFGCHIACGILVPQLEIELAPPALKAPCFPVASPILKLANRSCRKSMAAGLGRTILMPTKPSVDDQSKYSVKRSCCFSLSP